MRSRRKAVAAVPESVPESVGESGADPVARYAAALDGALHGPRAAKARLVEEVRGGFEDTVAAYEDEGLRREEALQHALDEFSSPDDLAPSCQRELTVAQARHTARSVVRTAPFLAGAWLLVDTAREPAHPAHQAAQLLAVHLAAAACLAVFAAAIALAVTGSLVRRAGTPQWLPKAMAWTGTAASVCTAAAALTLAITSLMSADWVIVAGAGALAAASHALVAGSARACRRCARLPIAEPAGIARLG
ncbi:permease prefix domain 1-containing protein [Yinghuangia soli]|uniref:Permease prefix domain 1-containing protein n=1 Tax=Yinghuangia soli TaxID=2908204 RepID=A0AA41Q3R8_9ACTN|nr:permease prefix domain 1-containing protein [Yinghuangia soli]MCF2530181.1 permease prefix domain 1-containing protein [Yinghuangia soli]